MSSKTHIGIGLDFPWLHTDEGKEINKGLEKSWLNYFEKEYSNIPRVRLVLKDDMKSNIYVDPDPTK